MAHSELLVGVLCRLVGFRRWGGSERVQPGAAGTDRPRQLAPAQQQLQGSVWTKDRQSR